MAGDNDPMDDTHTPRTGPASNDSFDRGRADSVEAEQHAPGVSGALDELAAVDPADAPEIAERVAAELSVELDEESAAAPLAEPSEAPDRP